MLLNSDTLLLDTLANLNRIGATINRIGSDETINVEATLYQIVKSATHVVPDASAVIYTYDDVLADFDLASRLSAGTWKNPVSDDAPRPDGLGRRAIAQRRRVLSYEESDCAIHPKQVEAGAKMLGCWPLIVAEQAVGVLYVYRREAHPFTQLELLLLDNFVNQAAMAIYHTHHLYAMQHNLKRKEEEIQHLRQAGLLISSRLRLEETLETILQMALEITQAHYGIFRLVDKYNQNLHTGAVAGNALICPNVETIPLEPTNIMGWVACHQQPALINDLQVPPWKNIYYPLDPNMEMRSELAVPLINASGRVVGVLNLESPKTAAFTEDDLHLLQTFAAQAVTTIQEVRLLDALNEVAEWLLTMPCAQMLEKVVIWSCDLLNAADSALWVCDGDELRLEAVSGGFRHGERLLIHDSLVGQAVQQQAPVITNDVCTDSRFRYPELAKAQGWKRALIVPVKAGPDGQSLGALSVYSTSPASGRFAESEWDKKVLTCLAHYAALALQNASRKEALRIVQQQRAAAETFAVMGDVASNLLHHVNNKVGAIPVRIQGIYAKSRETIDSNPYLAHNLHKIEECAAEALESVRENLTHLHPGELEAVDIIDCVQVAIQAVNPPPNIQVRPIDLDTLPMVMANHRSMTLVFSNLLENAAHAMCDGGNIIIHGQEKEHWVDIWVQDDGPGIPRTMRECIFDLNVSSCQDEHPGKLGFGLWWVKTLMTRLGGIVKLDDTVKQGASFHLRLPRAEDCS